jgi:transposase InsO family protein
MRRLDELHLAHPFLGARRLADRLQREGWAVGRRHVGTLMRRMGIEAIYCKRRTSIPAKGHQIYPYLLANVAIERPNQAWAADISYATPREVTMGLKRYFSFYNEHRGHQSLDYQTPDEMYFATGRTKKAA